MQAWERLEKAEHERELALRTELIRQEKLEQLAARFDRKAAMRETWLSENQRLVAQVSGVRKGAGGQVREGGQPHQQEGGARDRACGLQDQGLPSLSSLLQDNFGLELAAVEAAVRKHEAIETDIVAYSGRVQAVDAVAAELAAERYHDIKRVAARQHNVARLWDFLRQMVAARRERLLINLELQKVFQDLFYLMDWMEEMRVCMGSTQGVLSPEWQALTACAPVAGTETGRTLEAGMAEDLGLWALTPVARTVTGLEE